MRNENEYETATILNRTRAFFDEIRTLFKRGKKRIDKIEFYDTYRPLLGGYEKGLTLEGTNYVLIGNGPSGGQSSMFVMLDAALESYIKDILAPFKMMRTEPCLCRIGVL